MSLLLSRVALHVLAYNWCVGQMATASRLCVDYGIGYLTHALRERFRQALQI
jgi:hypothetical protein